MAQHPVVLAAFAVFQPLFEQGLGKAREADRRARFDDRGECGVRFVRRADGDHAGEVAERAGGQTGVVAAQARRGQFVQLQPHRQRRNLCRHEAPRRHLAERLPRGGGFFAMGGGCGGDGVAFALRGQPQQRRAGGFAACMFGEGGRQQLACGAGGMRAQPVLGAAAGAFHRMQCMRGEQRQPVQCADANAVHQEG